MRKEKLNTYAAMVKEEDDIQKNSMKLYSYLLCIAGKDLYSDGRIFQQKNLVLTEIQRCTGLQPKTTKLYLYELEMNRLVIFKGEEQFHQIHEEDFISQETGKVNKTAFRKAKEQEAFKVWKERDKKSYYKIPRPRYYTPIPEITLEKLNTIFNLNELELKLYILCCTIRDIQVDKYSGKNKSISYECLRDFLKISDSGSTYNKKIKTALYLLKGIGLIDFENTYYLNEKNFKTECFELKEVYYYVKYTEREIKEEEVVADEDIIREIDARLQLFDESCYCVN